MNPALIPLGLGVFQALQKLVDTKEVCTKCQNQPASFRACELYHDSRWDNVLTSVLLGVMLYCLTQLKMSGLAWGVVAPASLLFLFMFAGALTADTYVPMEVPLHPALTD